MRMFFSERRCPSTLPAWGAVLVLVLAMAACSGGTRAPETSLRNVADAGARGARASGVGTEYRLGPGDKLKIVVFGHQDVSGEFVIDGSGNVALPLVGQFSAGALTVTELQESLHKTLNEKYIVNPRVSVEVLNYRPFFILGEVNKPGSYPYVAGIDVVQAVALGGGYTRRARTSSVKVTRDTRDGRTVLTLEPGARIFPGDTIEVQRRLF